MQPHTGHLVDMQNPHWQERIDNLKRQGYEEVPNHLDFAARRKLNGNREAMVSLTSGGKLSRWAASKRKKRRQKAKAARRANRHQGGR